MEAKTMRLTRNKTDAPKGYRFIIKLKGIFFIDNETENAVLENRSLKKVYLLRESTAKL